MAFHLSAQEVEAEVAYLVLTVHHPHQTHMEPPFLYQLMELHLRVLVTAVVLVSVVPDLAAAALEAVVSVAVVHPAVTEHHLAAMGHLLAAMERRLRHTGHLAAVAIAQADLLAVMVLVAVSHLVVLEDIVLASHPVVVQEATHPEDTVPVVQVVTLQGVDLVDTRQEVIAQEAIFQGVDPVDIPQEVTAQEDTLREVDQVDTLREATDQGATRQEADPVATPREVTVPVVILQAVQAAIPVAYRLLSAKATTPAAVTCTKIFPTKSSCG